MYWNVGETSIYFSKTLLMGSTKREKYRDNCSLMDEHSKIVQIKCKQNALPMIKSKILNFTKKKPIMSDL